MEKKYLLLEAIYENNLDVTKKLLKNDKELINSKFGSNETVLFYVESLDIAKLLIENNIDINAKDKDGDTAINVILNIEILSLLIKHGANINTKNNLKESPLHSAVNTDIAKLFIENGADINTVDKDGRTPLHWVVTKNPNCHIAELLLENGADINAVDEDGRTPLHLLVLEKQPNYDIAELLFENGANVNLKDNLDNLALDYVEKEYLAQKIIENNFDIEKFFNNYNDNSYKVVYGALDRKTIYSLCAYEEYRQNYKKNFDFCEKANSSILYFEKYNLKQDKNSLNYLAGKKIETKGIPIYYQENLESRLEKINETIDIKKIKFIEKEIKKSYTENNLYKKLEKEIEEQNAR